MDERTSGIILRVRPLTDTSLIVQWLTPDLGRIATVAKGARRPKSPFGGKIDLFFFAAFSFARSRRSELHTLREIALQEPAAVLRHELQWLRQASYAAQLIEQTTETETPLPNIFTLMQEFLRFLPQSPPQPMPVLAFEFKLLSELGLGPDPAAAHLTAGARQIVLKLGEFPWARLAPLRMTIAQINEVRGFLAHHLLDHVGKVLSSRATAVG